jgi:hypothetical protein
VVRAGGWVWISIRVIRDDDEAQSLGRGPRNDRKGQTDMDRIAITIPAGPTEIATIENAIAMLCTRST